MENSINLLEKKDYPEYFCGADVKFVIGHEEIDIISLEYTLNNNKSPIFGYESETFDAVAKGTILVQGNFVIPYLDSYILKKLNPEHTAKGKGIRPDRHSYTSTIFSQTKITQGFGIYIKFMERVYFNTTTIDMRATISQIYIDDCHITSESTIIDQSGQPIGISYRFFAKEAYEYEPKPIVPTNEEGAPTSEAEDMKKQAEEPLYYDCQVNSNGEIIRRTLVDGWWSGVPVGTIPHWRRKSRKDKDLLMAAKGKMNGNEFVSLTTKPVTLNITNDGSTTPGYESHAMKSLYADTPPDAEPLPFDENTPIAPAGTTGIYTFVIENSIAGAQEAKEGILTAYLLDTDSEFLESLVNMTSRTATAIQTEMRDRYIQLSRNSYIRKIRVIGISDGTIRVVRMNELNIKTVKNPTVIDDIEDIREIEKSGAIVYANYYITLPETHVEKILKIVDIGAEYDKMHDYSQLDPQKELIDNMDYIYVDGKKNYGKWQKNTVIPKSYKVNTYTEANSVNSNTNYVNRSHVGLNKP